MENVKLFTRSDLDRCARLALMNCAIDNPDPEQAIARAVQDVVLESPAYYDEDTVKRILMYLLPNATEADATQRLEDALEYLRK